MSQPARTRRQHARLLVAGLCVLALLVFPINVSVAPVNVSIAPAPKHPDSVGPMTSTPPSHPAPQAFGRLPLAFEANLGQHDAAVQYAARGRGYNIFLAPAEAVIVLKGTERTRAVRMRAIGARPTPEMRGEARLTGIVNYFIGNDRAGWRTSIPIYAKVRTRDVYPGVDFVYYGVGRDLEYDVIVAPGADPRQVVVEYAGVERVDLTAEGDLVLRLREGALHQRRPQIYQGMDGTRREIVGGYSLRGANQVGFWIGAYDAAKPLIIDPALTYSTYLGGSGSDIGRAIALDSAGNVYVTGETASVNFPTAVPFQPANAGGTDVFVTKVNAAGTALVYSTYLGGAGTDIGADIAVDAAGNAYVTGQTGSANFPTASPFQAARSGSQDAFLTKLDAAGATLVYSTYLGGGGSEFGQDVAVDSSGSAYVAGDTGSSDFPTASPFQAASGGGFDAFLTKMTPAGTGLVYSTYLGGSAIDNGRGLGVDGAGNAYVAGHTQSANFPTMNPLQAANAGGFDLYLTKVNAAGSALVYSTYLGGSLDDFTSSLAVDAAGNAHVTGETSSTNFPTANPLQAASAGGDEVFITKVNAAGTALIYSTYLGSTVNDIGNGIAVDGAGNAYVIGQTGSASFPTMSAPQPTSGGGTDAFVTKLNAAGSAFVYSTFLGGSGTDIGRDVAVGSAGNVYVTGQTGSVNFPLVNPLQAVHAGSADAFITRISPSADVGMYSPASSTFLLKNNTRTGAADLTFIFGPGGLGWTPVMGDWDGNGTETAGLYDPATGTFYLRNTNNGGPADVAFGYGPAGAGWIPIVGDWDGNGTDTVGLFDPATSTFYLRNANGAGPADVAFGYGPAGGNWTPVAGDWDGNNTDTVGLYDQMTATFYLRNANSGGPADLAFAYGAAGANWAPLAGDWNGDRLETVGLYNQVTSTFLLRNTNSAGPADLTFVYGAAGLGWLPRAGNWDGS